MTSHFIWLTYYITTLALIGHALEFPINYGLDSCTAYSTEFDVPSYDTKVTITVGGISNDNINFGGGYGLKRGNMTGGMSKILKMKGKRQSDVEIDKAVTKTVILSKPRRNKLNSEKTRGVKDGYSRDSSGWEKKVKTKEDKFSDYYEEETGDSKSEKDDGSSISQEFINGDEEETDEEKTMNCVEMHKLGLMRVGHEDNENEKGKEKKPRKPYKCLVKHPEQMSGYYSLTTCLDGKCGNVTKKITTTTPFLINPNLAAKDNIDDDSDLRSQEKRTNLTEEEFSGSSPSTAQFNADLESQDEYYDSISEKTAKASAKHPEYKSVDFDDDYKELSTTYSRPKYRRLNRTLLVSANKAANNNFSKKRSSKVKRKKQGQHRDKKHASFLASKNRTKRFFVSNSNHKLIEPLVYTKVVRKRPQKTKIADYDGGWRPYWSHTKAIWDPYSLETDAHNVKLDNVLEKTMFKRSPEQSGKHKWDIDYVETPSW